MGAAEQMLKAKVVHKSTNMVATEIGERLFIDDIQVDHTQNQ